MRRSALLWLLTASTLAGLSPAPVALGLTERPDDAANAQAVLERTKTAHVTYAAYSWHRMTLDGAAPVDEWSAEFHSGTLHRVETPRDRVIADCRARTGSIFNLAKNQTTSGPWVADAACGITTERPVISQAWLGLVDTPFGKADRVRFTDSEFIRTYDVGRDGVILHSVYAKNAPGEPLVLVESAVARPSILPAGSMFDVASLQKSFVPERYKHAPAPAR